MHVQLNNLHKESIKFMQYIYLMDSRPEPIMLLKLPIMLLSNVSKFPYYAPIMSISIPLCSQYANIKLCLKAVLEYLMYLWMFY